MAMPAPTANWTAEQVRALQDESRHWPRYEVIDGELFVTSAPRPVHQEAVGELSFQLRAYLKEYPAARVFTSPADVEIDERTLVQPDVFVVPLIEGRRPRSWKEVSSLLFAIEVRSPSSARADRNVKRWLYQREGVPEYWIVDLDARLIERWRPGDERPEIITDRIEWQVDPARPALTIELPAFFREICDD